MLKGKEKEKLFRDIWARRITEYRLPVNLYLAIAKDLQKGLFKGFKDNIKVDIKAALEEGPAYELLRQLTLNIYRFSAAKTFQQVKDMQHFILDDAGMIRSYSAFKKEVAPVYKTFNEDWQRTEFDTAVSQAQGAALEAKIQEEKDVFPLARYETAADDKVRPDHASWDGVTLPIDHPWWDEHTPPNGFNCRCTKVQLDEGQVTSDRELGRTMKHDAPMFQTNPYNKGEVFKEKGRGAHPVFKVAAAYQALKKKNFNLPLPEDD